MNKRFLGLAALASILFISSCTKNDSIPQEPSANLNFSLTAGDEIMGTENVSGVMDDEHGVFTWTGGMAAVSEIHIQTMGNKKMSYSDKVPQVIDLFNAWNNIGNIKVPEGVYDSIEFRIVFAPTDAQDALNMSGTFEKSNTVLPINVIINDPLDLSFVKYTPTKLDANMDYNAAGSMALTWLAQNVDENMLWNADKVNGIVVISKTVNPDLYQFIWKTLNEGVLKVEVK